MVSEKDRVKQVRTIVLPIPSKDWESAALALTHEAKNLYNTVTFLVRQVHTAYEYNLEGETKVYTRKAEHHPNQIAAIDAFNAVVAQVNAKREAKRKEDEVVRLVPLLENVMTVSPFAVALDATVLDNVTRGHIDKDGDIVYRRLPAKSAQEVVRSVIDVWKASLSAMSDYARSPDRYSGRPAFPGFLDPNGHFPVEMPVAMMKHGRLPKPKDLKRTGDVSVEELERFYAHDLIGVISATCRIRGWDEFTPQHVRIVHKGGRAKVEAVIAMTLAYPEGSFLKVQFEEHGDEMREHKTVDQRERYILSLLKANSAAAGLRVAGIDVGETNVLTAAFSTGHRAFVYSGERPMAEAEKYQRLIDSRMSEVVPPRMKELQRLRTELMEKNLKLDKPLFRELRKLEFNVQRDTLLRSLRKRIGQIMSDLEHKITSDLIDRCVKNRIDVVVVGRNKRMKSQKDWGAAANRKSHVFAHARLLSLLRYKAEKHGIAVVTTEESYTSKTSFVDNEVLKVWKKGETEAEAFENVETTEATEDDSAGLAQKAPATVVYSGRRSTSNRNWFNRRNAGGGRLSRVHADVNGAFNIVRKVFSTFSYHEGISCKFTVRRISPSRGAVGLLSLTG